MNRGVIILFILISLLQIVWSSEIFDEIAVYENEDIEEFKKLVYDEEDGDEEYGEEKEDYFEHYEDPFGFTAKMNKEFFQDEMNVVTFSSNFFDYENDLKNKILFSKLEKYYEIINQNIIKNPDFIKIDGPSGNEVYRRKVWLNRIGTWPQNSNSLTQFLEEKYQNNDPNYIKMMNDREEEILSQIKGKIERWENYIQFTQGKMLPRFTKNGFLKIRVPSFIYEKIRRQVDLALEDFDGLRYENGVGKSIYSPEAPKFIDFSQSFLDEILLDFLPYHEEWSGLKLVPTSAYGIRLYQNESSIVMHHDKPHTHIISSIVHIVHKYDDDNRPWPLMIDGHDGKEHSVVLEEGEMLFYESAKCLHGRREIFHGKYYGSIFIHYKPIENWNYNVDKIIENVPPHWALGVDQEKGSRWAGQAITVDSRVTKNAPKRDNLEPKFSQKDLGLL